MRHVLKNTKTNQYSDGNYGWTSDINEARLYQLVVMPDQYEDHIKYVEVELKEKQWTK